MNNYPYNFDPYTGQPVNQPYAPAPIKKPKVNVDFTKKDYVFTALLLIACVLSTFIGLFGGFALGFTVSAWIMIIIMALFVKEKGRISAPGVIYLITALCSSVTFALWESDTYSKTLAFAVYVLSCILFTTDMSEAKLQDSFGGSLKILYMAFLAPFEHMAVPFRAVFKSEKKKTYIQILVGIVISIPVLCVVIPILMSSDAAFTGLVELIAKTLGMTIVKVILTVAMFVFLISYAVVCKFKLKKDMKTDIKTEKAQIVSSPLTITFLTVMSIVYLVYMFSQLAYFFSAFKGILPEGYSFSFATYARRGFFETEAIAIINLLIIVLTIAFTKRKNQEKIDKAVKAVLTFIAVFSILFVVTAISKMFMYIKNYDLTVSRLEVSVFMLITIIFIIAFIVKIYSLKVKSIKVSLAVSAVLLTVVCLIGITNTVANYNTNAFLSGKRKTIDVAYLEKLEVEAIPSLAKLSASDDEMISKQAAYTLYLMEARNDSLAKSKQEDGKTYLEYKYTKNWKFTFAAYRANKALKDNKVEYVKLFTYDPETDMITFILLPYEYNGKTYKSICYNGRTYLAYGKIGNEYYDLQGEFLGDLDDKSDIVEVMAVERDERKDENYLIVQRLPDNETSTCYLWRDVDTIGQKLDIAKNIEVAENSIWK